MSAQWDIIDEDDLLDKWGLTRSDVDDILERWLAGEDVSEGFEDDGTEALIKEDEDGS